MYKNKTEVEIPVKFITAVSSFEQGNVGMLVGFCLPTSSIQLNVETSFFQAHIKKCFVIMADPGFSINPLKVLFSLYIILIHDKYPMRPCQQEEDCSRGLQKVFVSLGADPLIFVFSCLEPSVESLVFRESLRMSSSRS